MSLEDSPTADVLCLWGVISVDPMCYRRRTSHTEGFVQALQSVMEHHVHHLCSPLLPSSSSARSVASSDQIRVCLANLYRP
ncbi:unnamed protein product [Brassica rapa subsp. trilocularis]